MDKKNEITIDENFFSDIDADVNYRNRVKAILDMAYAGIIIVDRTCTIKLMNNKYETLLNISNEEAIGKHIMELFPESSLPAVIASGKADLGHKFDFSENQTLVLNRIPLKIGSRIAGAMTQCIFSDLSELKILAKKLDVLETKVKYYQKQLNNILSARYTFDHILGDSKAISNAKKIATLYARKEGSTLILGETGTGKELFAHAIHNESPRVTGPFVCVNCAAIPKDLIGSELFGYEPGAFSGAHHKGKMGKIELADRGTLFLDEIGDLTLDAQATLLRVLEEKRIDKIGGTKSKRIDFRLISATNKNLQRMMKEDQFRDDLYHRISTMPLFLPTLKARKSDILLLIDHFLAQMDNPSTRLSNEARDFLLQYDWPGNIRELKNEVERSLSLANGADTIDINHLNQCIRSFTAVTCGEPSRSETENQYLPDNLSGRKGTTDDTGPPRQVEVIAPAVGRPTADSNYKGLNHTQVAPGDEMLKEGLAQYEMNAIRKALEDCNGNKVKAAKLLGIARSVLYRKLDLYDIPY